MSQHIYQQFHALQGNMVSSSVFADSERLDRTHLIAFGTRVSDVAKPQHQRLSALTQKSAILKSAAVGASDALNRAGQLINDSALPNVQSDEGGF